MFRTPLQHIPINSFISLSHVITAEVANQLCVDVDYLATKENSCIIPKDEPDVLSQEERYEKTKVPAIEPRKVETQTNRTVRQA